MRDNNGALWFLVGVAVGGAIALLYAPQSGKETRDMLGRKTDEGRELFEERSREFLERGREMYEKGRELAEEAADMVERGRKLVRG
jgi:gas vesicle protein